MQKWSEWQDLNLRPPVPQTGALTGLRHTPMLVFKGVLPAGKLKSAQGRKRCGKKNSGSLIYLRASGPEFSDTFPGVGKHIAKVGEFGPGPFQQLDFAQCQTTEPAFGPVLRCAGSGRKPFAWQGP